MLQARLCNRVNRRAQEEIVGFVLIVVIVAVIFVIFLGISLNEKQDFKKESKDIRRFIESTMDITTGCALNNEINYINVRTLLQECYRGKNCLDGKNTCNVLNETLQGALDASWNVAEDSAIKGYIFNADYSANVSSSSVENIIKIERGKCMDERQGAEEFFSYYPGSISYSLEICY